MIYLTQADVLKRQRENIKDEENQLINSKLEEKKQIPDQSQYKRILYMI